MTRKAMVPVAAAIAAFAAGAAFAQSEAPMSTAPAAPQPYAAPTPVPAPPPPPAAPQTPPLTAEEMWPDAPPPPPPPPPVPPLPASGDGAQLVSVLSNLCVPLIAGGDIKSIGPSLGFKKTRTADWVLPLTGVKKITVTPPDPVNPNVCILTVVYDLGQQASMEGWVDAWAENHSPRMLPVKVREATRGFDFDLVTSTWMSNDDKKYYLVALNLQKKFDGSPAAKGGEQARVLLSVVPK